jgi:hypothetical protein
LKKLYFIKHNLRNVYGFTVPCSYIIEILDCKRSCLTFADLFPYCDFLRSFAKGSAKLRWAGRGARSALFCLCLSLKFGCAHCRGAPARPKSTSYKYSATTSTLSFHVNLTDSFPATSPLLRHKKYYVHFLLFMLKPLAQN